MIEDTVRIIFSQAAPRKGGSVFNNWSWNQLELWIFFASYEKGVSIDRRHLCAPSFLYAKNASHLALGLYNGQLFIIKP